MPKSRIITEDSSKLSTTLKKDTNSLKAKKKSFNSIKEKKLV